jgi:NAD(P)-dependent dehydrogenase (short-subunit alcohol dehydrogenase family)
VDLGIAGRRALVTGASSGIGAATARCLAAEGAEVVLVARRAGPLDQVRASISAGGGRARVIAADVTSQPDVDRLADALADAPVQILVNNVGGSTQKAFLEMSVEDWQADLDRNLLSAVRVTRAFLPTMIGCGWGRVVHVGSIAAREPGHRAAPYAAAKAALLAYSKAMSSAVARHGVTSTVVLPGMTDTAALARRREALAREGVVGAAADSALMGRRRSATGTIASADQVAAAIVFLCSAGAESVTGVAVPVDNGTVLGTW